MKTFQVTYSSDFGVTNYIITVTAPTYTEAYVSATQKLPKDCIIAELFEVV